MPEELSQCEHPQDGARGSRWAQEGGEEGVGGARGTAPTKARRKHSFDDSNWQSRGLAASGGEARQRGRAERLGRTRGRATGLAGRSERDLTWESGVHFSAASLAPLGQWNWRSQKDQGSKKEMGCLSGVRGAQYGSHWEEPCLAGVERVCVWGGW